MPTPLPPLPLRTAPPLETCTPATLSSPPPHAYTLVFVPPVPHPYYHCLSGFTPKHQNPQVSTFFH